MSHAKSAVYLVPINHFSMENLRERRDLRGRLCESGCRLDKAHLYSIVSLLLLLLLLVRRGKGSIILMPSFFLLPLLFCSG